MANEKTSFPAVSFDEFPIPSYAEWKEAAEKTLKGASFDKKLLTKTFEGITLQPIYTQEDVDDSFFLPGEGSYRRGTLAAGYQEEPLGALGPVLEDTAQEANAVIKTDLSGGADGINLKLHPAARGCKCSSPKGVGVYTVAEVKALFDGVDLSKTKVNIPAGASSLPLVSLFKAAGVDMAKLNGVLGADPLSCLAVTGQLPRAISALYDEMAETVKYAEKEAPGLKTVLCSGEVYASGGADSATELACVMASASEYMQAMTDRGVSADAAARSISLTLTMGSNYFMEIAKVRAARVMFANIAEAFGASKEAAKANITAVTSAFNKTVYDPYVNVLRTTTEAFSGVVGGADNLAVAPFDDPIGKSDDHSRRIARNISVMLKEEFNLEAPVDPAGGSWYVETLTSQLLDMVWDKFSAYENEGGLFKALQAGTVQNGIDAVLAEMKKKLNTRALRAVGTNMYANMTEEKLTRPGKVNKTPPPAAKEGLSLQGSVQAVADALAGGENLVSVQAALGNAGGESCTAIEAHRLTEDFEALRDKTVDMGGVKVFLANMGPIPQHKARADFSTGFFEVGGFTVLSNDGFETAQAAADAAAASGAKACVICSTDDTYPELVPELTKLIKSKQPDMLVIVAGMPAPEHKDAYLAAGVWDFVHVRANCYDILSKIQAEGGK